jgi:hypothetical protein
MTTHAPLQPIEQAAIPAHEDSTAQLAPSGTEPIIDSLPLLDHRTRSHAISERLAPRGHYLAVQDGEHTLLVPLGSKITHLGRGLGSDVRVEEQRVSRSHAIIVRHGRYARVLDNRSSNGTFVNGRRVIATNVGNGDVILLGPVAMQYVEVS